MLNKDQLFLAITQSAFTKFDKFNPEIWIQELVAQGKLQGHLDIEKVEFPVAGGPRLDQHTIDQLVADLNTLEIYVSSGIAGISPPMGLVHFDPSECKITLSYRCSEDWENLDVTTDVDVRNCKQCQKSVYRIMEGSDITDAIENNACVSFFK